MDRAKRYLLANFEHLFVLVTLLSTLVVNYLVPAKLAFLNFYFLPIILAGYYLGRRTAVLGALLCALMIAIYCRCFLRPSDHGGRTTFNAHRGVAASRPGRRRGRRLQEKLAGDSQHHDPERRVCQREEDLTTRTSP